MAEKKHIAFAILDILTTYTDEDHILTAREIMDFLKAKYNTEIERRTLYSLCITFYPEYTNSLYSFCTAILIHTCL